MKQLPRGGSNSCLITREQGLCFVQYLCNKSVSSIQNLFIHCGCRFDQLSFGPAFVFLSSLKFIFDTSVPVSTHIATTQRCKLKRAAELVNRVAQLRGNKHAEICMKRISIYRTYIARFSVHSRVGGGGMGGAIHSSKTAHT